ncbi:MAG: 1,2-phenylacetyl-CoA epoxidase subunit PaaC [Hyphomicrobiales bacterium]
MSTENSNTALTNYVLQLGDNALVLGHRLSEWSSFAPNVELDIALSNHALDLLGQARMLLTYAGELEGRGRDEDDLAYLRDPDAFTNVALCELPNGDFAFTMMRQVLYASFTRAQFEALISSKDEKLAAIAAKAEKELAYHLRHCGEWVVRLGDGTEESHKRTAAALEDVWPYVQTLLTQVEGESELVKSGVVPDRDALRVSWQNEIDAIISRASLRRPSDVEGFGGVHTEHLAPMLKEMQVLKRQHPEAQW